MSTPFRLKNHFLMMALAAAYPLAGHAAAARIDFAVGSVVAINGTGGQRSLGKGSQLEPGETIRTGDNGRAQLRFSDGAMMSLQPQTEFRIDEYRYSGKNDGEERGFFSLIKGGLRTITGLVGKGNKDNYRVTTSVATIGIRGTEYSAVFSGGDNGVLNTSTGEGAIEICNSGGCVTVANGQSAVVTGVTPPRISQVQTSLPAATTTAEPAAAVYSDAETRTADGSLVVLGGGSSSLRSGPGYSIASVSNQSGLPYLSFIDSTTATFGEGSKLQQFADGNYTYTATTVSSAFSLDGVIGWGYWASGSYADNVYNSTNALTDMHYVVGKPTDTAELSNLSGMVGTYTLVGYTAPTSTTGLTGGSITGSLTADFANNSVDATIGMSIGGYSVVATANNMEIGGSAFSGSGIASIDGNATGSVSMNGLFAGTNASHAGLAYEINTNGYSALDKISGAAVFKQESLAPSSPPL